MKQTKLSRTYQIFLDNPKVVYTAREIYKIFNESFPSSITFKSLSGILSRLYKKGKISRSRTQVAIGYLYSLENHEEIGRAYDTYLLPYEIGTKESIKEEMISNHFPSLKSTCPSPETEQNDFVSKYGANHFRKKETKIFLSSLVAFVMGDGHIRHNHNGLQFYFREKADAEVFKENFLTHFPKDKVTIEKTIYCYACIISSKPLSKLLFFLGAPSGSKVFKSFLIPDWILHGPSHIKLSFLSTIYGNEGSKPQDRRWRIQFVMSKNEKNLHNLLVLHNQIRAMLKHFDISTSFIQVRKQKGRQYNCRFYIKGKKNLHLFHDLLEFSYASEKQRVLVDLIQDSKQYSKVRSAQP